MLPSRLKADCAKCCGLCCVVLPFDASQGFAFDKPAHTPCSKLRSDYRCSIHGARAANGFSGCAAYDCYGAGQWVVQHLFSGATWRESPYIANEMFDAFWRARVLHELMAMLTTAIARTDDDEARGALDRKLQSIEAICDDVPERFQRVDVLSMKREVTASLRAALVQQSAACL